MDTARFYRLMDDVSLLNNETLPELKQLVDDYPYFQTARMLYLKNLAILNDGRFGTELRKTAVYVPDRRMLYILIEEIRLIIEEREKEQTSATTDPFELIDQFLHENSQDPAPELVLRQPLSGEYFPLNFDDNAPVDKNDAPPLKHGNLIDDYLKEEEQNTRHLWRDMDDEAEYPMPESIEWLQNGNRDPGSLSDSYFTETLARIFIKQKRYEKALEIIRNLSLNFPEKNVYFADQIRFLEKLIINIKKYS